MYCYLFSGSLQMVPDANALINQAAQQQMLAQQLAQQQAAQQMAAQQIAQQQAYVVCNHPPPCFSLST